MRDNIVWDFVRKKKKLSILFFICLYLMIKNSSIPYLFDPGPMISLLFDSPKSVFFKSLSPLIDIFSSAYVTSLIFYIFIEFIPTQDQEKKAKEVIKPHLAEVYSYLDELLAMIRYSAELQKILPSNDITKLDKLIIKDKEIYCKMRKLKDGKDIGVVKYSYNLLTDVDRYRNLILKSCCNITSTHSLSYCDSSLIHTISEIQLSELLKTFPGPNDVLLGYNIDVTYFGLGESYQKLLFLKEKLLSFLDEKTVCVIDNVSSEEINSWTETQAKVFEENPEMKKIVLELQKSFRNQKNN